MKTLTYEYELFRMKLDENIQDMKKCFIPIMNHMRIQGNCFQNEDLAIKVLRCLNHNCQIVTTIYEFKNLSSMDFATLFRKLQEHEMELKRLAENKEN